MFEKAYAKINISLDVIGQRPDGYHDLDMLMAPVGLYDALSMELAPETTFRNDAHMPYNEKNTIRKAIELMRAEFGFTAQFRILLSKHIPFLAGLAGGSSDAAAAMRLVNRLVGLGLSEKRLAALGQKIGSDVPFFFQGRCARVTGLGEQIAPFDLPRGYDVLLIKPARGVSTKWAYQNVDLQKCAHPDIASVQHAFIAHEPLAGLLGNSLEQPAFIQLPQIADIEKRCRQAGFDQVLMSGSGSTVFVLTEPGTDMSGLMALMDRDQQFVYRTQIIQ